MEWGYSIAQFKFFKSNTNLSFDQDNLRVNGSSVKYPYNFKDGEFNYTITNATNNLKIIRNDGFEILINESSVILNSQKDKIKLS